MSKNGSAQTSLLKRSAIWATKRLHGLDLHSPRTMLLFWFAARLAIFLYWALISPGTQGDVIYYYQNINALFHSAPRDLVLREYPTPVVWLLAIFWLMGFGTQPGYVAAFCLTMVALDAAFAITLWRMGGRLAPHAVAVWVIFITACGPTVYLRFDLITSVIAGWALLAMVRRRPQLAGGLAALGAAVKLWPALLWPALCVGSIRRKLRTTVAFFVTGIVLALASLIWAGWDRLISPLTWQSGRGLQVESVWASIPMLGRALGIGDYAVNISRFQAFEIYGTGVQFWMQVASIAFLIGLLVIVAAFAAWLIRGHGHLMESFALTLAVILIMIATNKTFSPQYVFWLGGPLASAFVILSVRIPSTPSYILDRRRLWVVTVITLVVTALTLLIFPVGYGPLVRDGGIRSFLRLPITLILVCRNVLVLVLLGYVLNWIASFLSPKAFRALRTRKDPKDGLEPVIQPDIEDVR